ncbi:MAG TPA: hypothetical protein PK948_09120 [Gemmatimonadales bacterium]|nr:hypothetical protein [Gemmatimonadales bacterium]
MTMFFLMRMTHILLGVFWAGTIFFTVLYLIPATRDVGPGAAGILPALKKRGYFTFLPIIALLTLASGFWLYMQQMTAGGPEFAAAWRATRAAKAYNIGAVTGLVAFLLGFLWLRPANMRMIELIEQMGGAGAGADRAAIEAELGRVRASAWAAIRAVAFLLLVAVITMSVARYK